MEWKKSELEQRLEKEGWRFLTNVLDLPNDGDLTRHYEESGSREVRIEEQAFDGNAQLLRGFRAVYVRP